MTKRIIQNMVFLQYGQVGEALSAYNRVQESDVDQFVALDSASGVILTQLS